MPAIFFSRLSRCGAFSASVLATLLATPFCSSSASAAASYKCTDANGLVLLTSDAAAARICKILSAADNKCDGKQCPFAIAKDDNGHLYLDGTIQGTRVRYPIDTRANTVTVCVRGQCKAQ
jgi:predicted aspartyl protease